MGDPFARLIGGLFPLSKHVIDAVGGIRFAHVAAGGPRARDVSAEQRGYERQ